MVSEPQSRHVSPTGSDADRVQLVGQRERVKQLHGIGADVDAGAELREFGRLLEDLYLEALMAKRNGRRQSPSPAPTMAIERVFAISYSATIR